MSIKIEQYKNSTEIWLQNGKQSNTHTQKLTKCWKMSFLATKSVSQLSSIRAALFSLCASASNPSAAVRADFFDASTFPLFLNSLCAASAKQYHIFTFKSTITLRTTQKKIKNKERNKVGVSVWTNVPIAFHKGGLDVLNGRAGAFPQLLYQIHLVRRRRAFRAESSRDDREAAAASWMGVCAATIQQPFVEECTERALCCPGESHSLLAYLSAKSGNNRRKWENTALEGSESDLLLQQTLRIYDM